MTWTATEVDSIVLGPRRKHAIVTITADSSYAGSGGETVDLSAIFPTLVWGGRPLENDAAAKYVMTYDRATSGAPATGKIIASYCDYDALGDGALIEVAGTTDLSTSCTGYWEFWGY